MKNYSLLVFTFIFAWMTIDFVYAKTSASIQEKEIKVIGLIDQRMVKTFQRKEKEKKQSRNITAK